MYLVCPILNQAEGLYTPSLNPHHKFDLMGVQTHDLRIMKEHFMGALESWAACIIEREPYFNTVQTDTHVLVHLVNFG